MSRILDLSAPTRPKTRHTRQIGWQQRKRSNLMASRARGKLVHGIYFLNKAGHPQSRTRSVPSDPLSNHIYPIAISFFFSRLGISINFVDRAPPRRSTRRQTYPQFHWKAGFSVFARLGTLSTFALVVRDTGVARESAG